MTERFLEEILAFGQRDRESPPPADGILFLGSSTLRLWTTIQEDFPGVHIINRGFGGSHIEDCIRYADRIVLPCKPKRILLYAGDNDLASGKTPDQVSADFRSFVGRLFAGLPRVGIVFISIKPSSARVGLLTDIRTANSRIGAFVGSDARLKFADVFHPMLASSGAPRPDLFGEDGLHMNASGYQIWKRVLDPYVRA